MDVNLLTTLLITAIVAILGWFVAHWLSSNRERSAKRRDLRVKYLIDAWRKLEDASNRLDNSRAGDIESAIADIQLFGSQLQIELAQKFAEEFAQAGNAYLDSLLEDLRRDLRDELQLESTSKNIKHLRIVTRKEQNNRSQ